MLQGLFEMINNYEMPVSFTTSRLEFCKFTVTDLGIQANFPCLSIMRKWGVS